MQTVKYTVPFIVAVLQNIHKVSETRYYRSDLDSCEIITDTEHIIKQAKLTKKQMFILKYHWIKGYTQTEVAKHLGVTQQMVEKHCRAIEVKIGKVLEKMEEGEK